MKDDTKRFLKDIAERGLAVDLNPTMNINSMTPHQMYQWWAAYVQRADYRLRKHARMVLAAEEK